MIRGSSPSMATDDSSHLMAYDLRTGEMETLLAEPIPAATWISLGYLEPDADARDVRKGQWAL